MSNVVIEFIMEFGGHPIIGYQEIRVLGIKMSPELDYYGRR